MNGKYQVGSGRIVTVTHDTPFIEVNRGQLLNMEDTSLQLTPKAPDDYVLNNTIPYASTKVNTIFLNVIPATKSAKPIALLIALCYNDLGYPAISQKNHLPTQPFSKF